MVQGTVSVQRSTNRFLTRVAAREWVCASVVGEASSDAAFLGWCGATTSMRERPGATAPRSLHAHAGTASHQWLKRSNRAVVGAGIGVNRVAVVAILTLLNEGVTARG